MHNFSLYIAFKPSPFLTPSSHTLSSSSFYNNVFPSLAFHKNRLLWKFNDCMNGQWRWRHVAKKCGQFGTEVDLSGCKVDHQSLFRSRQETYLTSTPPPSTISPSPFLLITLLSPFIFLCCRFSFRFIIN